MTEDFSEGPFTKDEVITLLRTLLGSEYDAEEDCYEMSGGYYCESHILTRPNGYSLYRCCARYGSMEDKRRFNRNVVWAGEMSPDHLLPTNNKERTALRKALYMIAFTNSPMTVYVGVRRRSLLKKCGSTSVTVKLMLLWKNTFNYLKVEKYGNQIMRKLWYLLALASARKVT